MADPKKETKKDYKKRIKKTILNNEGMFAVGYGHGVKKKLNEIDKSNTPIRKLKKDVLPKFIDQRDLVGSKVIDYATAYNNKFGRGYKKGLQDAADAANKGGRSRKIKPVEKKSGGILKAAPNEGVTKLPKDVRNKMGFLKKGGAVKKMKKCRMDGIALRGKTRAKQRSK